MPIRIGVSPRAWMMKGEAAWKAPSAAAPLISVRRLRCGLKIDEVICSPLAVRCVSFLNVASPGAQGSRRRAVLGEDQAGHWILQPVSAAAPAAFSPGTGFLTVNMLSGSPWGGCASPANTVL